MAICAPINPCPCHPWQIGPGETLPLIIDWSAFLQSVPGYALHSVASASISDLNVAPVAPVDPDLVDTVPTIETAMPWSGDNPPVKIIQGVATESLISVTDDVAIGQVFRYDIAVNLKGCDGRVLKVKECVFIQVQVV